MGKLTFSACTTRILDCPDVAPLGTRKLNWLNDVGGVPDQVPIVSVLSKFPSRLKSIHA